MKEEIKGDVLDLGGGYRDTMTNIIGELAESGDNRKVICLIKCTKSDSFRLNEQATSKEDRELFVMLGAILAFAFLTGQCFGV